MFERYHFRLNIAVSIGLRNIIALKNFTAKVQHYEYAIRLSEIEKYFLNIEQQLGLCKSPEVSLTKGLTPKGTNFYNEIFTYAIFHHWKDIPQNFIVLLKERKAELNEAFEFNEDVTEQLAAINRKFVVEEDGILAFLKKSQGILEYVPPGMLTIKCYTKSNYYEFSYHHFDHAVPFYQLQFPLNDFVNSIPIFYGNEPPPLNSLASLKSKFSGEKICLLFTLLAVDGLLAWEDFMNIETVEIDLDLKYRFTNGISP